MAYDKVEIFDKAKQAILHNGLFFIDDVIAFLPIAKSTFYEFFPIESNQSNELKELLETNRTNIKVKMRKKWLDSENATLQMGLMKMICTDEERKKLSTTYSENENKNENKNFDITNLYGQETQTDLE